MRHSAGTNLSLLDLLLEVVHGDIHPEVAVKIDDDGIDAAHSIEDSAEIVVVADLCGPLLTLQSEFLTDEAVGESLPVIVGISHMMGIEVARSATELCGDLASLQTVELFGQTIDVDHDFLAQACGRGRLSMRLGEHGHVFPLIGILLQLSDELFHQRIVDIVQSLLQ